MKLDERSRRAILAGVLVLGAVSAYRYYADADAAHEPGAQSPPAPAGWDALYQCGGEFDSFTVEGTVLSLKLDGSALVTENYDDKDQKREHTGDWTYDGEGSSTKPPTSRTASGSRRRDRRRPGRAGPTRRAASISCKARTRVGGSTATPAKPRFCTTATSPVTALAASRRRRSRPRTKRHPPHRRHVTLA
jgi:hypothetical protein